jgi:hypothetical protein
LALLYNDRSVLENHHCARTFAVLRQPQCNILSNASAQEHVTIRGVVVECILATDMTSHFEVAKQLKFALARHREINHGAKSRRRELSFSGFVPNRVSLGVTPTSPAVGRRLPTSSKSVSSLQAPATRPVLMTSAERLSLAKALVHCADIGNPTKPWEVSKTWADRVLEEFLAQGDQERRLGFRVSPNMDRETISQAQMSLNFIDFIVAPLFEVRQIMKHPLFASHNLSLPLSCFEFVWVKLPNSRLKHPQSNSARRPRLSGSMFQYELVLCGYGIKVDGGMNSACLSSHVVRVFGLTKF